uniref:Uncharacterized protein n=1 Tax=viral metagenome TaxID=1070528 RepID=A0A6C0KCD6_9ZZZZ
MEEPLLSEKSRRFTLFPIKYPNLWDCYEKQLALFWTAKEVDFSKDLEDFETLSQNEQHYLKRVLAFFAASDGIVNFNISSRFLQEITVMEASVCYSFQMAIENIHSEVYSIMLDNLVKNTAERDLLFNSIQTVDSVKLISDWAFKWINSDHSFAHRVIAFCVVEGVFFSGAFASIFWLKRYKSAGRLFLQGLVKSNEFIARDEGMHVQFGCEMYRMLVNKLSANDAYCIIEEGVVVAKLFMTDALPVKLLGMSSESMCEYIEYVSDRLLVDLGYPKKYGTHNPFSFMETIGMVGKTNFFESRPTEYQSAYVLSNSSEDNHEIMEDF